MIFGLKIVWKSMFWTLDFALLLGEWYTMVLTRSQYGSHSSQLTNDHKGTTDALWWMALLTLGSWLYCIFDIQYFQFMVGLSAHKPVLSQSYLSAQVISSSQRSSYLGTLYTENNAAMGSDSGEVILRITPRSSFWGPQLKLGLGHRWLDSKARVLLRAWVPEMQES